MVTPIPISRPLLSCPQQPTIQSQCLMLLNLFKSWLYHYCIFVRVIERGVGNVYMVFLCSKLTTNLAHSYGLGLFSSSNGFFLH